MAEKVGEISKFDSYFEWNLTDFISQLKKAGEKCISPPFLVCRDAWTIWLYPNGNKTSEFISVYLKRLTENGSKFANFTLSINKSDGTKWSKRAEHLFSKEESNWGFREFVHKSRILNERNLLVPEGVLTISCIISSESLTAKATSDASKPEDLPNGGACTGTKVLWDSLRCNLKDLFLNHTNSDMIIKVRGEEFPVHKMILSARSTVFAAMFEHNMVENLSGVVEISDANPDTFKDLLLFIYSGEVKTLTSENVQEFYELSDIYDLKDLKDECTSFLDSSLSVDTVCDLFLFADKYNEAQLKVSAERYFVQHASQITKSDQWKTFELENPPLAIQFLKSIILEFSDKLKSVL